MGGIDAKRLDRWWVACVAGRYGLGDIGAWAGSKAMAVLCGRMHACVGVWLWNGGEGESVFDGDGPAGEPSQ